LQYFCKKSIGIVVANTFLPKYLYWYWQYFWEVLLTSLNDSLSVYCELTRPSTVVSRVNTSVHSGSGIGDAAADFSASVSVSGSSTSGFWLSRFSLCGLCRHWTRMIASRVRDVVEQGTASHTALYSAVNTRLYTAPLITYQYRRLRCICHHHRRIKSTQEGWLSPTERASVSAISLRHIFASPGYAPGTIAVNVTWMERGFNTGQMHSSIYPSIFNSLRAIARYWSEIATFSYPLAFNAPVGVFPLKFRGKVWSSEN